MNIVIILAGGVGSRVGGSRPKQFVEVLGKPILAYTVEIYQNHQSIDVIGIVCHEEWMEFTHSLVQKHSFSKVKWIIKGGNTFQSSVMNGVNYLRKKLNFGDGTGEISEADLVLIHYGAAPFTSDRIIEDCIKVTYKNGNAFTATPSYQLLGSNDENGTSHSWIDRNQIVQIACPYGFRLSYLLSIYDRAEKKGLIKTIEPHTTSLAYALGDTLYQSYGNQTNIKITTKEDLDLFEGFVMMKEKRRL